MVDDANARIREAEKAAEELKHAQFEVELSPEQKLTLSEKM